MSRTWPRDIPSIGIFWPRLISLTPYFLKQLNYMDFLGSGFESSAYLIDDPEGSQSLAEV
jgi:hypothetical protein